MVGIALITGVNVILGSAKSSITSSAEDTRSRPTWSISGDADRATYPPTFDPAVLDKASRKIPAYGWSTASTATWRWSTASGRCVDVRAATCAALATDLPRSRPPPGTIDRARPRPARCSARGPAHVNSGCTVGSTIPVQLSRGDAAHLYGQPASTPRTTLINRDRCCRRRRRPTSPIPQPIQGFIQLAAAGTSVGGASRRWTRCWPTAPRCRSADRGALHQAADQPVRHRPAR